MSASKVNFQELLSIIDGLSPEQKRIIRQRIDEQSLLHFDPALDDFYGDVHESETDIDINTALDDSRRDVR